MRAGSLRHLVKIQTPSLVADSYSAAATTTWNDTDINVRASIIPLRGKERIESMKLEGEVSHRIRIRYRSGITPKMRIAHKRKGVWRYFNIKSVINISERSRQLEMLCTEEV
jgi:SPP1 family predicted phage head-tail adaptor